MTPSPPTLPSFPSARLLGHRYNRLLLLLLWLALIGYAVLLAPPPNHDLTQRLIHATLTMQYDGIDPAILAVWNLLGLVPLLYASLLLPMSRWQRVPAWPFLVLMLALGGFVMVPYLLLRSEQPTVQRSLSWPARVLQSRAMAWLLVVGIVAMLALLLLRGSASAYLSAYQSSALIAVMSWDLVLCAIVLPYVALEASRCQTATRAEPAWATLLLCVPLLGPALWNALARRPVVD